MRIDINQKKIAIGDKYQIFVDGQPAYKASNELFRFLSVINLFRNDESGARLTIKKQWFFWKPKYTIRLHDNRIVEFRADSWWEMHYRCHCSPDSYHVYGHRGRKYSVYRNDRQVAWWEKEAVSWFEGDNYTITADHDCDVDLIIAFCLIMDNHKSKRHGDNTVSFDIGNIGGQVRVFDPYWKPKNN
jgi:uncharacterized protein YxjI